MGYNNEYHSFDKGDRVEHKIFGFGTVVAAPAPMVGVVMDSGRRVNFDGGWRVRIRWDDDKFSTGDFSCSTLTKLNSTDTKHQSNQDCEWQILFKNWTTARREVEFAVYQALLSNNSDLLDRFFEVERKAKLEINNFLDKKRTDTV